MSVEQKITSATENIASKQPINTVKENSSEQTEVAHQGVKVEEHEIQTNTKTQGVTYDVKAINELILKLKIQRLEISQLQTKMHNIEVGLNTPEEKRKQLELELNQLYMDVKTSERTLQQEEERLRWKLHIHIVAYSMQCVLLVLIFVLYLFKKPVIPSESAEQQYRRTSLSSQTK